MEQGRNGTIRYSIFDPTGNITALVMDSVPISLQPSVAAQIMQLHPTVEQVGFVRFPLPSHGGVTSDHSESYLGQSGSLQGQSEVISGQIESIPSQGESRLGRDGALPELRMAGGEFCGNASMCAAALYAFTLQQAGESEPELVYLRVSGAGQPVEVKLKREDPMRWSAGVTFPPALSVDGVELDWDGIRATVPLVRMEGISHLVIEEESPFFRLMDDRKAAGEAVKAWCEACDAPGLGLMFLEKTDDEHELHLTPLVYIPGSDTLFWENSCASGSASVGMLLAHKCGKAVDLALKEPGGTLRVESDPENGETRLFGNAIIQSRNPEIIQIV